MTKQRQAKSALGSLALMACATVMELSRIAESTRLEVDRFQTA